VALSGHHLDGRYEEPFAALLVGDVGIVVYASQ
jgi:hypothetical protein